MFPLHLVLSPNSILPETRDFPAETRQQPATARLPGPLRESSGARKTRRAAWALTWLGPETAIVPPVGMNVPGVGQ